MKTILLKFSGPLQSWGSGSHFEIRHTDLYPSKSAVIGLIAASCGFRRDENQEVQRLNRLHYAVRIDQGGHVMRDYQTAHRYQYKPDKELERTYVTQRHYLEDSVFVAAVGSEDDAWIDEIGEALKRPYFQQFMGRRSCPVPADCLLGIQPVDVLTALMELPWQAAGWYRKRMKYRVQLVIHADAELLPDGAGTLRRDRVLSFSPAGRSFAFREEGRTVVSAGFEAEAAEHDAFDAIGGQDVFVPGQD